MSRNSKPSPNDRFVIETFDKEAPVYGDAYLDDTSIAHSFKIRRQRVYELVDHYKGGQILDIGCGPGVTVDRLLNKGFEFFGVDASREMINECNKKFGSIPKAHFSVGRIESLEFPSSFFDVVLCMGVLEYLEDDDIALREMARVIKPGGAIIITLPNRVSPYRVWDRAIFRPLYHSASNLLKKIKGRPVEPLVTHKEYREGEFSSLLVSHRLMISDLVYYNFKLVPSPLDVLFPRLTVLTSAELEFLCRGAWRWLGTGFIVKAKKI